MESFTSMSDEAISATIDAMQGAPGNQYPMELNHSDFSNFLWVLQHAADSNDIPDHLAEWASSLASSIGETLGIEYV